MTVTMPDPLLTAGDRVQPVLRAAVAELHPDLRSVVEYHRGWVDMDGRPASGGGGKCVRAALAILSAEPWADDGAGLTAGAAVEMAHDFSLLHDDIMDGDDRRRHRATAWTVFGPGRAMLAGDALLVLANRILIREPRATATAAVSVLLGATHELIDGQARDVALERSGDADLVDCIVMSRRKTGALLSASACLGAVLAGAPQDAVGQLRRFGSHLGLAFQAVDDILGIWGDPETTGKPAGSDLKRRKRTLPVTFATEQLDDGSVGVFDGDVELVTGEIERLGGRGATERFAQDQLSQALAALEAAGIDRRSRSRLAELARFVVERDL
jgi:geranylgeranyl diphosphate synthase type I